ncbi:hypothetical protein ACFW84_13635 [Streptomyces anulatus]|uniref:hypothetical protein n=1 Tax=Streptomyces anulatus TaxID=1892 RepID=UPI0036CCE235
MAALAVVGFDEGVYARRGAGHVRHADRSTLPGATRATTHQAMNVKSSGRETPTRQELFLSHAAPGSLTGQCLKAGEDTSDT